MLILILVQSLLFSLSLSEPQSLTCYQGLNKAGDSLKAISYIESLSTYNMAARIQSCCVTGVWILYSGENYSGRSWIVYGDTACTNLPRSFLNVAHSLRFTGAPDDWHHDTINLYFGENFTGGEEFSYSDSRALEDDNKAKSAIVTGCQSWTLYQYDDYMGQAVCLQPSQGKACLPGLYSRLGRMSSSISSVRRGCWSRSTLRPDNIQT